MCCEFQIPNSSWDDESQSSEVDFQPNEVEELLYIPLDMEMDDIFEVYNIDHEDHEFWPVMEDESDGEHEYCIVMEEEEQEEEEDDDDEPFSETSAILNAAFIVLAGLGCLYVACALGIGMEGPFTRYNNFYF
jgi:hypothetical protein